MSPPASRCPVLHALLAACHRRDAAAQQRLYREWYGFARTRALPYGAGEQEVQEIVQDSFLKLFLSLIRQPFDGNFTAYFHRVIVNAGIDHFRRYHKARTSAQPAKDCGDPVSNQALEQLEREDCIRLLQSLPPAYRLVFNLYVFEGYQHPEIADRLGITAGTSRSHLFKARRALRPLVSAYFNLNLHHDE